MEMIWTKNKPTEPGAYWVRNYCVTNPKEAALVEVRDVAMSGELCSSLHEVNSEITRWRPISRHFDGMEWCGPLVPPNA